MNEIATRPGGALAEVSSGLAALLTPSVYAAEGGEGAFRIARQPRPEHVNEARAVLEVIAPTLAPASVATVRQWMLPIAASVRNPPGPAEAEARFSAVALACEDLPGAVFTKAAQRRGFQTWEFWPSAADVRKVLMECGKDALDRLAGLRRVASFKPRTAPQPDPELTPAERARQAPAIREIVANLRVELGAPRPAAPLPASGAEPIARPVPPRHLAGDALTTARAAVGIKPATPQPEAT